MTESSVLNTHQCEVAYEIDDIGKEAWDECANTAGTDYNPFVDYRFLKALEESKSVCAETGWQPFHVKMKHRNEVVAVMPMYLKSHSHGEFVFDGSWASAWYQAGGKYYPKLQSSVPFTPATGPRLLAKMVPYDDQDVYKHSLLVGASKICERIGVSSLHITFLPKNQWDLAGKVGYLQRVDRQFHWVNHDYQSFDDFLEDLPSKKRKNIRRERRHAVANDIDVEWVSGNELTEAHWDAFYEFYEDTSYRKWGAAYLNREFFSLVSESMSDHVLLILAKRNNRYVAGAINFVGGDTLFGRNWGCVEHHRFLHFEICYYQAIDYAIEHNLSFVEAGAQGGHKFLRGYMPRPTYSAHWIPHAQFRSAVAQFLGDEKDYVARDIEYLESRSPFKNDVDFSVYRDKLNDLRFSD